MLIQIQLMQGLGDTMYAFPVVRWLANQHDVAQVVTPWPQIFRDLDNVECVRPQHLGLRTQLKNADRTQGFHDLRRPDKTLRLCYVAGQQKGIPMWKSLCKCAGMPESEYLIAHPLAFEPHDAPERNFVLFRPATIRTEWKASARNCHQRYIQAEIDRVRGLGQEAILIADIEPGKEEYVDFRPDADRYFEHGELDVLDILRMMVAADHVVAPVGFMVPFAMALGVTATIIHGGAGGWNGPEMIDAPGLTEVQHILPDRFCRCRDNNHNCNKTINRYEQ